MAKVLFSLRCPDCGRTIDDSDDFCSYCGINLDAPLEKYELEALTQQYLEKAQKRFDKGLIKWALVDCDRALENMPELAEAHNLRGLILDKMGKTDEALLEYQEAVRLNPGYADAIANLEDAESEYQHTHKIKFLKRNKSVILNFRLVFFVTGIGFIVQGVRFMILVLSNGEPENWYQLISNFDILGPALIYPFLADREYQINISSGVIAGVVIAIPLSILETFLGIIFLLLVPPPFVSNFTDIQNLFSQSHPTIRLGYLLGLFIAPAVVMIKKGAVGAIGGALSSLIVTTKNMRKESIDGHESL